MKKIVTGILIVMLSMATSQAVYANAVGKFIKVEGRVDVTRDGNPAELVSAGTEVFEKDIVRSKSDSRAEILFADGNILRLAQKTRIEISEYIVDSSSNKRSAILNLFRGKIQNKVKKLLGSIFGDDGNRYEVHTPTSVCGVRGTDFFMFYQKGVSGATFKEGFGYGYNRSQPDSIIEVQAGQSMVISGSNAPPVVREATQVEINKLEEETTPVEEDENVDEDNNTGESDSGGTEENVTEETDSKDDEAAAEEGDKEGAEKEVVDEEKVESDSEVTEESATAEDDSSAAPEETEVSEGNEPETDIADEGPATVEETDAVETGDADSGMTGDDLASAAETEISDSSAPEQGAAESDPVNTAGSEAIAMADSSSETVAVEDSAPASDSGFAPSDNTVSSAEITDGGVGSLVLDDNFSDSILASDPVDDTMLASNTGPTESVVDTLPADPVVTDPVADAPIVDIPQEVPDNLDNTPNDSDCTDPNGCDDSIAVDIPSETDNGTDVSTDIPTTDPAVTDPNGTDPNTTDPNTTDPNATDPNVTDPIVTDPVVTDPVPAMTVSGKLMGIVSGRHYEGEYILPPSEDPRRSGYFGKMEDGRYEYDYFTLDDGQGGTVYLRGRAEEETSNPDVWTMYDYLPDGTLRTEIGGPDTFSPDITESTWSGDLSFLADPPTGYFLRYSNDFDATMTTKIGDFTGDIFFNAADLWGATETVPLEISLSGQYTANDTEYLFVSHLSDSFADGGTYVGFISGDAVNAKGIVNAIYINPEGTELGILKSNFSGSVDASGAWSAAGTIYPMVLTTDPGTITNANFTQNIGKGFLEIDMLKGSFTSSGEENIKSYGFGDTAYLRGYDWGIFNMAFGYSKYDETAVSNTWTGAINGYGVFGEYQNDSLEWLPDGGMWFAEISNGIWQTGEISADISGRFLTTTKAGTIEGKLIGPGGSAGDWTAVSQGTWTKSDDLQFSSNFGGNIYILHSEEGGSYSMATDPSVYSYHYDLYSHQGGYQFYDSVNDTDTYMEVNAWDFDGTVADFHSEQTVYDHTSYGLISYTAGTWTDPLQYFGEQPELYTNNMTWDYHDQWTSYNMFETGWLEGILGGLESPWTAGSAQTAPVTILGFYERPFYVTADQPVMFASEIESFNPDNGMTTTIDGGAYSGFMGAIINPLADPQVNGNIYAIYIDPDNNAGVLLGKFQGPADRMSGVWYADGDVYPVQLYSPISVAPDTLTSEMTYSEYHMWDNGGGYVFTGEESGFYDEFGYITSYIDLGGGHVFRNNINGQPWGVWQYVLGGVYSGTPGSDWLLRIHNEMYDEFNNVSGMIGRYEVSGGNWADNNIDADVLGAWVDLKDAVVGLSSGKINGTYDPAGSPEMTWQMLGSGVWLGAGQFLDMAATPEGRATLDELNIPAFEIGRTTLSGSSTELSVTMNDVTFFASSTGGTPRIWATNNISGTYSGNPVGMNVYVTDSSNTFGADFIVKKWDNSQWGAEILNGNITLDRTDVINTTADVRFSGVAGGAYTGSASGTFSGEGAGVAR